MDEIKAQKKALKKAYKKPSVRPSGVEDPDDPLRHPHGHFHPPGTILIPSDNTVAAFVGGTFWKLENEDPNAQYVTTDFSSPEEMVPTTV